MIWQAFLKLGLGVRDGKVPVLSARVEVMFSLEQCASDAELPRGSLSVKKSIGERN